MADCEPPELMYIKSINKEGLNELLMPYEQFIEIRDASDRRAFLFHSRSFECFRD
jgi:hypothetical protein